MGRRDTLLSASKCVGCDGVRGPYGQAPSLRIQDGIKVDIISLVYHDVRLENLLNKEERK